VVDVEARVGAADNLALAANAVRPDAALLLDARLREPGGVLVARAVLEAPLHREHALALDQRREHPPRLAHLERRHGDNQPPAAVDLVDHLDPVVRGQRAHRSAVNRIDQHDVPLAGLGAGHRHLPHVLNQRAVHLVRGLHRADPRHERVRRGARNRRATHRHNVRVVRHVVRQRGARVQQRLDVAALGGGHGAVRVEKHEFARNVVVVGGVGAKVARGGVVGAKDARPERRRGGGGQCWSNSRVDGFRLELN